MVTLPPVNTPRRTNSLFAVMFCVGALLRVIDVWMPPHAASSWHEFDSAAIARNYYREGMNLLYPRVDWRGDTPGFAEMEFPVYQWSIAILYKLFGFHDYLGRAISFALSLITLWMFIKLARYLLSPVGAIAATLFATVSPLLIALAHALQPEAPMLCAYVIAIYTFLRWRDTGRGVYGVAAAAATAMAILAKAPAAHVGGLYAAVLLGFVPAGPNSSLVPRSQGLAALRDIKIWLFGICALLPSVLWYWHAYGFWKQYGLSLGVSNEYHYFTRHLSTNLLMIRGIADVELRQIWTLGAPVFVLSAVLWNRSSFAVRIGLWWAASVAVLYLLIPRTVGQIWASYYHGPSVLVAAVFFGAGFEPVASLIRRNRLLVLVVSGLTLALLVIVPGVPVVPRFHSTIAMSIIVATGTAMLVWLMWHASESAVTPSKTAAVLTNSRFQAVIAGVVAAAITTTFFVQSRGILRDLGGHVIPEEAACARRLGESLPPGILVVLGANSPAFDPGGLPNAHNSPSIFYWADRKGFNLAEDQQSIDEVLSYARRGAKYFVAEKGAISADLDGQLRKRFPIVEECDGIICFRLSETDRPPQRQPS